MIDKLLHTALYLFLIVVIMLLLAAIVALFMGLTEFLGIPL